MVEALLSHLELLQSLVHSGGTSTAAPAQQLLLLDIIGFLLELSPSSVLAASQPSFAWLLGMYTSTLRWVLRTSVSCRVLQLCQAICLHPLGPPCSTMLPGIQLMQHGHSWALQL